MVVVVVVVGGGGLVPSLSNSVFNPPPALPYKETRGSGASQGSPGKEREGRVSFRCFFTPRSLSEVTPEQPPANPARFSTPLLRDRHTSAC